MSEKFDGNSGWQVNNEGDVIPDGEMSALPQDKTPDHDVYTDPMQVSAQEIDDNFDPKVGLTPEQARILNESARQERGGRSVTPNPRKVRELPGKNGRPTNWKD